MYTKSRGRKLFDRCIASVLALVMLLSVASVDVLVGHADTTSSVHTHTFACYDDYWLDCAYEEDADHEHTFACYRTYGEPMCGLEEGEPDPHRHGKDGFDCSMVESVVTCGMENHKHSEECMALEEPDETDEDDGHVHGGYVCGLMEHEHTAECVTNVYKCRYDMSDVMFFGAGTYIPGLHWNINDSTMTPRDETKTFVTWNDDSSENIAAIATLEARVNVDVEPNLMSIKLPLSLYKGRDEADEGKLNLTSLRDVLGNTPFEITNQDDTTVTLTNTRRVSKSSHVSVTLVYNINMVNTIDKTEFSSLRAEFDLAGDKQTLTIGGQLDTGIRSLSGYTINDKDYSRSEKGRFYRWSDSLQTTYGVTGDEFKEIIDSGYVLIEHSVRVYEPTKNQPATYSIMLAPSNEGQLVSLQKNSVYGSYDVQEGKEGNLYKYTITPDCDYKRSDHYTLNMLMKYPASKSLSASDANQVSVSNVTTVRLDGVDGEDYKEYSITTRHNSMLATPGYRGNIYHLWHSKPGTPPAVLDSGLQVLSAGKDLETQWFTESSVNYRDRYKEDNTEYHTHEIWNDKLYISDGLDSVYELQPGDYSYTRLSFSKATEGEAYFDSNGNYAGTTPGDLANKGLGGKYRVYVLTPESPEEWVYDGEFDYKVNGSQSYTFKAKDAFAWKVAFDKAYYFSVMNVWAYADIHGSSENIKHIADTALNSSVSSLDLMSWAGMGVHSNKEGAPSQSDSVRKSEVTGDTAPLVQQWDAKFWDKYGFNSSADQYPQRWNAKQVIRSASMLATINQYNGVIDVNGKVTYGSSAATVASNGIMYDINAGLSFSTPLDDEQGRGMVEAVRGNNTAVDALTAVFYTLLPAGYELKSVEAASPHTAPNASPSGTGPLNSNSAGAVYAYESDMASAPTYGRARAEVTNNFKGSGQQLVKTTVTFDTALLSKYTSRYNDVYGTYWGVVFPLNLEASYTIGAAPTGTYTGYTLVEFLDGEGRPYNLEELASTGIYADDGSAFSFNPTVSKVMSGVGSAKALGHEGDRTMLAVNSNILTNVTATVTGGQITASSDSYPGWSNNAKAEADDEHYYWRLLYTNQTGSSDDVLLMTALEYGVEGKEGNFTGLLDGIDTSYAESVGAKPRIFVNARSIDKNQYVSTGSKPNGVSVKDLEAHFDNWSEINPSTFTQWNEVKSVAVYFDKEGSANGFTFDRDTGWAYVVLKMKFPEGENQLQSNKSYVTHSELLVHASHKDLNSVSTTLADSASLNVDTSYQGAVTEYVAGAGWTSAWPTQSSTATTYPGDDYAYRIEARVTSGRLTDVVLYDSIEDEIDAEWKGTLKGIARITRPGTGKFPFDVGAKLYVNKDHIDKAEYMEGNYGLSYLNDVANGWQLVSNPAAFDGWSEVKSVAVALGSYVLTKENGVTFGLQMVAPTTGFPSDKATYTTDSAFMTYQIAGASGKDSRATGKVSVKVDLTNIAAIKKTQGAPKWGSDGRIPIGLTSASNATATPGALLHYTISGASSVNDVIGTYLICDDLSDKVAAGYTLSNAAIWTGSSDGIVYMYTGDEDTSTEAFWEGVTPVSLAAGMPGWSTSKKAGIVRAIAGVHSANLYTDSTRRVSLDIVLNVPDTGLTEGETVSVENTGFVKFTTKKSDEWYTTSSNTVKADVTPNGTVSVSQRISAEGPDGEVSKPSQYSSMVTPNHMYAYDATSTFTGYVADPLYYGSLEYNGQWQGALEHISVSHNLTSRQRGREGTPVNALIYVSTLEGEDAFPEGFGPEILTADGTSWALYEVGSDLDLGEYKSWVVYFPNSLGQRGYEVTINFLMQAPKYGMADAIENDICVKYKVLGCDAYTPVVANTVKAIPIKSIVTVDKVTLWEPTIPTLDEYRSIELAAWRDDVDQGRHDTDGNTVSEGLKPFYWGIALNPKISSGGQNMFYGWAKDMYLIEDLHSRVDHPLNLVTLGIDDSHIPDDVPITAYVSSERGLDLKDTEGPWTEEDVHEFCMRTEGVTEVLRSEFDTFDWSDVKFVVFYFGDENGAYEWEYTEETALWCLFIQVQPEWSYEYGDRVTGNSNWLQHNNEAGLWQRTYASEVMGSSAPYTSALPIFSLDKDVSVFYGNEYHDLWTDYDTYGITTENTQYMYRLSLTSLSGEGASDIVLFDSLEGMEDSTIHGTLTGVDVDEFTSLGIPVTIYGNKERLTAEQLSPCDVERGFRDDRTVAEMLSKENGWYVLNDTSSEEEWASTKSIAIWLGDEKNGSWWDDGKTLFYYDSETEESGGVNAYIHMEASDLFKDEEGEEPLTINEVYIARNQTWLHYRADKIAATEPAGMAGVNFIKKSLDDLDSEFSKSVSSGLLGSSEKGDSAQTPLGGDYSYNIQYELKEGAANVAFGDTIEGISGESGWHGNLTGVDVQSILDAGYTPEVWVSEQEVDDWGKVFGDPATVKYVDEADYEISAWGEATPAAVTEAIFKDLVDVIDVEGTDDKYFRLRDSEDICFLTFKGIDSLGCSGTHTRVAAIVRISGYGEYQFGLIDSHSENPLLYKYDVATDSMVQVSFDNVWYRGERVQGEDEHYFLFLSSTCITPKEGAAFVPRYNIWYTQNAIHQIYTGCIEGREHEYVNGHCVICGAEQPVKSPSIVYDAFQDNVVGDVGVLLSDAFPTYMENYDTSSARFRLCPNPSSQYLAVGMVTLQGSPMTPYLVDFASTSFGSADTLLGCSDGSSFVEGTQITVITDDAGKCDVYAIYLCTVKRGSLLTSPTGEAINTSENGSWKGYVEARYIDETMSTPLELKNVLLSQDLTVGHTWVPCDLIAEVPANEHMCTKCDDRGICMLVGTATTHSCPACGYMGEHLWRAEGDGYHTCTYCDWKGYCEYKAVDASGDDLQVSGRGFSPGSILFDYGVINGNTTGTGNVYSQYLPSLGAVAVVRHWSAYSAARCSICRTECVHSYEGNYCSKCGVLKWLLPVIKDMQLTDGTLTAYGTFSPIDDSAVCGTQIDYTFVGGLNGFSSLYTSVGEFPSKCPVPWTTDSDGRIIDRNGNILHSVTWNFTINGDHVGFVIVRLVDGRVVVNRNRSAAYSARARRYYTSWGYGHLGENLNATSTASTLSAEEPIDAPAVMSAAVDGSRAVYEPGTSGVGFEHVLPSGFHFDTGLLAVMGWSPDRIMFTDVEAPTNAINISAGNVVKAWMDMDTLFVSSCEKGAPVKALSGKQLFANCSSVYEINANMLDVSGCYNLSNMFDGSTSLVSVYVDGWDVSKVANMSALFYGCNALTSVDLSSWVFMEGVSFRNMFANCYSLVSVKFPEEGVIAPSRTDTMFVTCHKLVDVNFSRFDTSHVTDMSQMFNACLELETLDLRSFKFNSVTNMNSFVKNCVKLRRIYATQFTFPLVSSANGVFTNSRSLPNYVSTSVGLDMWKSRKEGGYIWEDYTAQDVVDYAIDHNIGQSYVAGDLGEVQGELVCQINFADKFPVLYILPEVDDTHEDKPGRNFQVAFGSGLYSHNGTVEDFIQKYSQSTRRDYAPLYIGTKPTGYHVSVDAGRFALVLQDVLALDVSSLDNATTKEELDTAFLDRCAAAYLTIMSELNVKGCAYSDQGLCVFCGAEKLYTEQDVLAELYKWHYGDKSVQVGVPHRYDTSLGLRITVNASGTSYGVRLPIAQSNDGTYRYDKPGSDASGRVVEFDDSVDWYLHPGLVDFGPAVYAQNLFKDNMCLLIGKPYDILEQLDECSYPLTYEEFVSFIAYCTDSLTEAADSIGFAKHMYVPLDVPVSDANAFCKHCGSLGYLEEFNPPTPPVIEQVIPWAGHTLGTTEDTYNFKQIPLEQLDSYDYSKVRSVAVRFTKNEEPDEFLDYFVEAPKSVNVKLNMKAPVDAKGTTSDLAYNRAVVWQIDGKTFESHSEFTNLTTMRLLGWNEMPDTGGSGITHFYLVGAAMMLTCGGLIYVYRKRRRNAEKMR